MNEELCLESYKSITEKLHEHERRINKRWNMDERDTIQEIRERLVKIEMLLENIPKSVTLQLENLEDKIKVANNRIKDLEENNKWLWRAVVGAVIAGAIALLFKK